MQQDDGASALQQTAGVLDVVPIAHDQTAEAPQPGGQPFDLPAPKVAPQRVTVLPGHRAGLRRFGAISSVPRCSRGRASSRSLPRAFPPISRCGCGPTKQRLERWLHQRPSVRRDTCRAYGDRKTSAVCSGRSLRARASTGTTRRPLSSARAKAPSMNDSSRSRWPRARRRAPGRAVGAARCRGSSTAGPAEGRPGSAGSARADPRTGRRWAAPIGCHPGSVAAPPTADPTRRRGGVVRPGTARAHGPLFVAEAHARSLWWQGPASGGRTPLRQSRDHTGASFGARTEAPRGGPCRQRRPPVSPRLRRHAGLAQSCRHRRPG
jgi:hypothetical protein